jgi:lipoprotein-releasing system ATP-binding protein
MTANDLVLKLTGITKTYESGGEGPGEAVLSGIDLEMRAGETVAIVGPSGCGKSTLLNIIGTLDRPSAGTVTLCGRDLTSLSGPELDQVRNKQIGWVFQAHHLLPQCSVLENVLVPTLAQGSGKPDTIATGRAQELLKMVGLGARMSYRPGHLSGGERQRTAVVRALVNNPRLLLADEPTGSLDRENASQLIDLLAGLNREQETALLVVTHSQEVASRMGKILELRQGKLIEVS